MENNGTPTQNSAITLISASNSLTTRYGFTLKEKTLVPAPQIEPTVENNMAVPRQLLH